MFVPFSMMRLLMSRLTSAHLSTVSLAIMFLLGKANSSSLMWLQLFGLYLHQTGSSWSHHSPPLQTRCVLSLSINTHFPSSGVVSAVLADGTLRSQWECVLQGGDVECCFMLRSLVLQSVTRRETLDVSDICSDHCSHLQWLLWLLWCERWYWWWRQRIPSYH